MESYVIDRAYPYIFVFLGVVMSLKYMKKNLNKFLLCLGFSLIILQIVFRSIASKSLFMPAEVNETIVMDFIIWGGVYIYTGVIFFLRFNFKRLSMKKNQE